MVEKAANHQSGCAYQKSESDEKNEKADVRASQPWMGFEQPHP
jgi:hypothetical protein